MSLEHRLLRASPQKNPFDFSDTSDLPDALRSRLRSDFTTQINAYADVVRQGQAAGIAELDIHQIMAAALRLGMPDLSQQTVRGYLNHAVEAGLLTKPNRLRYSYAGDTLAEDAYVDPLTEL